jgi:hypothetical protein
MDSSNSTGNEPEKKNKNESAPNEKQDTWDTCSLESLRDILREMSGEQLDQNKLGFNLPTNDKSKDGDLDNLSVDSFWIGDDEEQENEKKVT